MCPSSDIRAWKSAKTKMTTISPSTDWRNIWNKSNSFTRRFCIFNLVDILFNDIFHIAGDCGSAHMDYIIRDQDNTEFQNRKNHLLSIAEQLNAKWGAGTVELCITDQYHEVFRAWEVGY